MSYPADLLTQARHLAELGKNRPKQVNLRRAISTAYYALFHLLTGDTSALLLSGSGIAKEMKPVVGRAFQHNEMKKAAECFKSAIPILPPSLRGVVQTPLTPELIKVARTFSELQGERHLADYNMGKRYKRQEVEQILSDAEEAFDAWNRTRGTTNANLFLLSLLLYSRWERN